MRACIHELVPLARAERAVSRRWYSSVRNRVREGDVVLLFKPGRGKIDATKLLTKPLRPDGKIETHRGIIQHNDIIGKSFGDLVTSSKQTARFRVQQPTLAEYILLTPRQVTPIYPSSTTLITSLLDIHVDIQDKLQSSQPAIEILEAGTGHGALTLHLAHMIHSANTRPPDWISSGIKILSQRQEQELADWKASRTAVLHTLDIKKEHSEHAQKIVSGFRRGLYAGNVDFHVGNLTGFLDTAKDSRGQTIQRFSHISLDLPGAHTYLPHASKALRDQGRLLVFCPQITQIADCVEQIQVDALPFVCEQVVEVVSNHTGGRPWTVELKTTRKSLREKSANAIVPPSIPQSGFFAAASSFWKSLMGSQSGPIASSESQPEDAKSQVWVCKPRVGAAIVNGGFIGVWRRTNSIEPEYAEHVDSST